jgi:septin family protein
MSAISKLTAVVPVISKADTFTAKEMEDFKKEIMQVRSRVRGFEGLGFEGL